MESALDSMLQGYAGSDHSLRILDLAWALLLAPEVRFDAQLRT